VERLADRFRALPAGRLRGGTAQAGLELARELSCAAQRLEAPGREVVLMPDEGAFTVGDQLAVAGHDLARALGAHPQRVDVLDRALRRVAETAERCDL
jgi:hypothetical protein